MITATTTPQSNTPGYEGNTWINWQITNTNGTKTGRIVETESYRLTGQGFVHVDWADEEIPEILIVEYVSKMDSGGYWFTGKKHHYIVMPPAPPICNCSVSGYHESRITH